MSRYAGFVGSRSLPASFSPLVSSLVSFLLEQGFSVASGGALGADSFALSALLGQGAASCGTLQASGPMQVMQDSRNAASVGEAARVRGVLVESDNL